uniref:COesterase domain-containing protein n=1 Tax=Glossina austeni TaxID=7395 RepID=A0A1A9VG83_GLOAU
MNKWKIVDNASVYGPKCWQKLSKETDKQTIHIQELLMSSNNNQRDVGFDKECLYLNIFIPAESDRCNYSNNEAPVNFGLTDQSAALLWIRKNITYFGGDAKPTTIIGHEDGVGDNFFHCFDATTLICTSDNKKYLDLENKAHEPEVPKQN